MSSYTISARFYGRILKAIRQVEQHPPKPTRRPKSPQVRSEVWKPFWNNSGETIPAFGVMRIEGRSAVSNYAPVILKCNKPNTTFQRYYAINGPKPVAAGSGGVCITTFGLEFGALYNTSDGTPAYGESWGAKSGEWKLFKNRPGFTIQGGPINGRVTVVQEVVNRLRATLDGDLTVGSSIGATLVDCAEMSLTVWDDLLDTGYKLAEDDTVRLQWYAGKWYVDQSKQCPVVA